MVPWMPGCSANFTYIPVKTTAQALMLLAHPAVNPDIQGLKHAVCGHLFFCHKVFAGDHMWER